MSENLRQQLSEHLPPLDQIGFVVRDADAAVRQYEPLIGAFEVAQYDLKDVVYRGRKVDCTLKIAIGKSGDTEVEFIEVVRGETYHNEFLERGGDGPHHIRFTVPDLDATQAKLEQLGLTAVFGQRFAPGLAFVYLEDNRGRVVEIYENNL